MALVLDSDLSVMGVITLEDVIEQLLQDQILDESDIDVQTDLAGEVLAKCGDDWVVPLEH